MRDKNRWSRADTRTKRNKRGPFPCMKTKITTKFDCKRMSLFCLFLSLGNHDVFQEVDCLQQVLHQSNSIPMFHKDLCFLLQNSQCLHSLQTMQMPLIAQLAAVFAFVLSCSCWNHAVDTSCHIISPDGLLLPCYGSIKHRGRSTSCLRNMFGVAVWFSFLRRLLKFALIVSTV